MPRHLDRALFLTERPSSSHAVYQCLESHSKKLLVSRPHFGYTLDLLGFVFVMFLPKTPELLKAAEDRGTRLGAAGTTIVFSHLFPQKGSAT